MDDASASPESTSILDPATNVAPTPEEPLPPGVHDEHFYLKLLRSISDQSKELHELRETLQALCEVQAPTHPRTRLHKERRKRELADQAWAEIESYNLLDDRSGNLREYTRREAPTLKELLSPHRDYPWTSWAYRQSYPALSDFLSQLGSIKTHRLQVTCTERTDAGKLIVRESKPPLHDHSSLWNHISTRFTGIPNASNLWDSSPADDNRMWSLALTRILNVRDLDPILAIMLMASIPRIHVSMIAAFLDRHIAFRNWASASNWALRFSCRNAFTFEYHIAFYSVSPTEVHPDSAVKDHRELRRSAVFGPIDDQTDRWIHEEQLSFILVGLGKGVFTCYHLSERYHNYPKASFAFQSDRYEGPTAVFLNWLTSSFHHVAWRWHRIVEALNAKIRSSADIVFSAEDPDLLSDDPKFTKSRTYFWALQTYKMFDERLTEIISTWEKFRRDRFDDVNDGVLPQSHVMLSLERIESSVEKMRGLQELVRKKHREVESLRHGLFGASALFDSRTAIRQGDNIRLLTYITLLFLPLTFTTSIYGMQVVLPQLPVKYFIITLPCVVAVTGLIVFNLQGLVDLWHYLASKLTKRLRQDMQNHHREEWREMADLLKADRAARQTPTRRVHRSTSHWDYLLFLIESVFFDLPVHEITWAWRHVRALKRRLRTPSAPSPEPSQVDSSPKSRAARLMAAKNTEELDAISGQKSTFTRFMTGVGRSVWTLLRAFCVPLWIVLATLEYCVLFPFGIFSLDEELAPAATPRSNLSRTQTVLLQPLIYMGFGRQKGSPRAEHSTQHSSGAPAAAAAKRTGAETEADEKAQALATLVEHVTANRRRARTVRMARRSIQGHGLRSTSGFSQANGRPRTSISRGTKS